MVCLCSKMLQTITSFSTFHSTPLRKHLIFFPFLHPHPNFLANFFSQYPKSHISSSIIPFFSHLCNHHPFFLTFSTTILFFSPLQPSSFFLTSSTIILFVSHLFRHYPIFLSSLQPSSYFSLISSTIILFFCHLFNHHPIFLSSLQPSSHFSFISSTIIHFFNSLFLPQQEFRSYLQQYHYLWCKLLN